MKKFAQILIAGTLAAGSLAATAQMAPQPPAGPAAPTMRGDHARGGPGMQQRMQERRMHRLNLLKQKLQLTAAQEGSWNTFVQAMQPRARAQRPSFVEMARLSTPERIDRRRALRAQRIAEADRRGDAVKAFYATLSADQKRVFDEQGIGIGKGGRRGGHHPRHHGGGYR